jgi:DNA modification methylase
VKHFLDPFVGIGSSAVAAQRLKVPNFTGFDIDPGYLATARERLEIDAAESSQQLF